MWPTPLGGRWVTPTATAGRGSATTVRTCVAAGTSSTVATTTFGGSGYTLQLECAVGFLVAPGQQRCRPADRLGQDRWPLVLPGFRQLRCTAVPARSMETLRVQRRSGEVDQSDPDVFFVKHAAWAGTLVRQRSRAPIVYGRERCRS